MADKPTKTMFALMSFVFFITVPSRAQPRIGENLITKAHRSIGDGRAFLLNEQESSGAWLSHPAISSMCVIALYEPEAPAASVVAIAINKALDYILNFVKPDGSIWSQDSHAYPNYTTSLSLLALSTVNRADDIAAIRNARRYLIASQFKNRSTIDYGGIGYSKTGRADVTNLSFAAEALFYTEYLSKESYSNDRDDSKRVREVWGRVQAFLTNCQNLPETNKQDWVSNRDDDYGGFVYRPSESKAGSFTDEHGKVSLLSSGSTTYSGYKTMIYSGLDSDDFRMKAALNYIKNHYSLKENPGMGQQGFYFYLSAMAGALSLSGVEALIDTNGEKHHWRTDMLTILLELQQSNGSWKNENGRYMESIPALATAYSLSAMRIALDNAK